MVRFASVLVAAALFTAGFASPLVEKRSYTQVNSDLTALTRQVNMLDDGVTRFQGAAATLPNALVIHKASGDIRKTLTDMTSHAQNTKGKFTASQSRNVISKFGGINSKAKHTADQLIAHKNEFAKLGVTGIASSDITAIKNETVKLGNALRKKANSSSDANALKKGFDASVKNYDRVLKAFK